MREPAIPLESQVSPYHLAAAALVRGRVGLAEMATGCINDPEMAALRARINAIADPSLARDQAVVAVVLPDGRKLHSRVTHARGGTARPMTDEEVDAKFRVSHRRAAWLRDVPTTAELGYPRTVMGAWLAVHAPTGMPADRVARLSEAFRKALEMPNVGGRRN